jgi:hypothetical protein
MLLQEIRHTTLAPARPQLLAHVRRHLHRHTMQCNAHVSKLHMSLEQYCAGDAAWWLPLHGHICSRMSSGICKKLHDEEQCALQ